MCITDETGLSHTLGMSGYTRGVGTTTLARTRGESAARRRLLDTAYGLFSRRGMRAVGIDEIVASSGVAKATLYRHFRSKEDLVVAFLEERERRWTEGWVRDEAAKRGGNAEERLLAIFDLFDEWFRREDFEACTFINMLLEVNDREHPIGRATVRHLANIRTVVAELAEEAGLREPDAFSRDWHILMKGAIVSAAEGDVDAARRGQAIARLVIERYRSTD